MIMNASSGQFNNKHILVTGAARGIGLEIAAQFAREGARLTLFDTHAENLADAQEKLQELTSVDIAVVDVSRCDAVRAAVDTADGRAPIDILVNNAGIAQETPFLSISEAEWRNIIDVNLTGMFFVAQAVCQRMATRKKGVVINMGSKNGLDGEAGYAHYNASKGGVVMLTKTMALELASTGIRVNAICPGYIQTPMSEAIDSPEFVHQFVDRFIPMGRPGKVSDVAPAFLFLAGEASGFITGQVLVIDGGQLAGQKPDQRFTQNT
jgi:3-oxoacyl-[acyl-carrier protein] reductase